MSLSAHLPMYRFPHTAEAWDGLWTLIGTELARAGFDAPDALDRPDDLHAAWRAPDLLLSQTCAMPFRQGLHRHVAVLGAWDLGLKDCPPASYNSVLVRRKGAAQPWRQLLATGRLAVNSEDSQSGWQTLASLSGRAPEAPLVTGAHRESVKAVRAGKADLCAVDAETWRLIVEEEGGAVGVEVCHRTPPTPGLPLITARGRDTAVIAGAVARGLRRADSTLRATLHIRGFVARHDADYLG